MAETRKNVGGRPRKTFDASGLVFTDAPRIELEMHDRQAVEKLCQEQIEELQNDFSEMKADAKIIVACLRNQIELDSKEKGRVDKVLLENFEKAQNRVRHICKDQSAILAMLLKQFELFSSLDRPLEDDPIYTPVSIVIDGNPPPEACIESKYTLGEDDIEPPSR